MARFSAPQSSKGEAYLWGPFAPPQRSLGSSPAPSYAEAVLADNPVAYYPLAANANDASGHGYDGVVTGGSFTTAPSSATPAAFSGCYANGPGEYITLPSGVNPSGWTALSVEAWVAETSGATSYNGRMVANAHTDETGHGFELFFSASGNDPGFMAAGGAGFVQSTATTTAGWHYYAGTYDGATGSSLLYLDNVYQAAKPASPSVPAAAHNVAIGYDPSYDGDFVIGYIAQVAIYSGVLTAAQISAHYAAAGS